MDELISRRRLIRGRKTVGGEEQDKTQEVITDKDLARAPIDK